MKRLKIKVKDKDLIGLQESENNAEASLREMRDKLDVLEDMLKEAK